MSVKIFSVEPGSPADKKNISAGDTLISVNSHEINDVLDYRFYINDTRLVLETEKPDGTLRKIKIKKGETEDIGLEFETYLMDKQHHCKNKCIFCFIDQLPKGLRDSLYFKDDDSRMSFLFGNYITLTNLEQRDVDRIIEMHISPVNISVHTMNPELRVQMMKNPRAGESLQYIYQLADAGIKINTQLVLCNGINDGKELEFSLSELARLYPSVQSIAAVPVGLSDHREGLCHLEPYTKETAGKVIDIIDDFNAHFVWYNKEVIAYAADEFYLKAEREIPNSDYYGDFPQLENGIGLWALLKSEFVQALSDVPQGKPCGGRNVNLITGEAAYPLMRELSSALCEKVSGLTVNVIEAKNRLFGSRITVAGLLCGRDMLCAAEGMPPCDELLIPAVSLRSEGDMFLDDMTVEEFEKNAGVRVTPVRNDGYELLEAMLGGV